MEANPSPTVVPDELEAAEQDMQEDEAEIFEIEPAAVEKPAQLGPASKQITASVRSEVTVSYETADPSLEARGLIKMLRSAVMSFLNFKGCKITVVTTATDLTSRLLLDWKPFARSTLNIDICSGNHCVVFLSRTRALAKIIAADQSGMTFDNQTAASWELPTANESS